MPVEDEPLPVSPTVALEYDIGAEEVISIEHPLVPFVGNADDIAAHSKRILSLLESVGLLRR